MFKILCCKEGRQYIPDPDLHDPEFMVYSRINKIMEEAKETDHRGARVEIEFISNGDPKKQMVKYHIFNGTNEFVHEFEKLRHKYEI